MTNKRRHRHIDVVNVEKETNGLVVITYQEFLGDVPVKEPWKAYVSQRDYDIRMIEDTLENKFNVPSNLIDRYKTLIREDAEDDFYETHADPINNW